MKANTVEDFLKLVRTIIPDERGCLIWPYRLGTSGYGAYKIKLKQCITHRLLWKIHNGEIPKGICIMHSCDNRPCVNIQHLSAGTWADNNRDRMRKGRSAVGERSGRVKLSDDKVREIRRKYATGGTTCTKLGMQFGVSNHQISQVVTFKSWRHVI